MKKMFIAAALAVSMPVSAGSMNFEWVEPEPTAVGTTLSYEIRWGDGTTDQIVSASGTTHSVEIADEPAVYYAQIRTVETHTDGDTLKSVWSPVVTGIVKEEEKQPPSSPTLIIRFELGEGLTQ